MAMLIVTFTKEAAVMTLIMIWLVPVLAFLGTLYLVKSYARLS